MALSWKSPPRSPSRPFPQHCHPTRCPQVSHAQLLNPRDGDTGLGRLFLEQERMEKVTSPPGPLTAQHTARTRPTFREGPLDTDCPGHRGRAGTGAVFSRKMLQGCDTSRPRQKCETGTFSVQPAPSLSVPFPFPGEGASPCPSPGNPGWAPSPSFLHSKHQGRKGNPVLTHHQI